MLFQLFVKAAALGVTHEVGLNPEIVSEVEVNLAATTKDIETGNGVEVRVYVDHRKTKLGISTLGVSCA